MSSTKTEFPAGAIINGRIHIERIEAESFEIEAGMLNLFNDWTGLKQSFERLSEYAATMKKAESSCQRTIMRLKGQVGDLQALSDGHAGLYTTERKIVKKLADIIELFLNAYDEQQKCPSMENGAMAIMALGGCRDGLEVVKKHLKPK